jgi:hypothetical protein
MTGGHVLGEFVLNPQAIRTHPFGEEQFQIRPQGGMVVFDLQDIVSALRHHLFRNRLLAAHRIDGHDRPVQIQQFEQFRNGGNLIALGLRRQLPQHPLILLRPSAAHVNGRLAIGSVEAVTQGLAINGNPTKPRPPSTP